MALEVREQQHLSPGCGFFTQATLIITEFIDFIPLCTTLLLNP